MNKSITKKESPSGSRLLLPAAIALLLLFALSPSWGINGDEVLSKVEATLTAPQDSESLAQMILSGTDGSKQEKRTLKIWMAGKEQRVIKFLTPAGIAGLGLLSLGDNEMYLYLPAQNKIRRIEGGSKNEEFQGTDFSYNELGSYEYKKDYQATLNAEDANTYTLLLTIKAGADRPYDKVEMVVAKQNYMPQKLEFFEKNVLKKRLTFLEIRTIDTYYIPVKIKMENLVRKHYTELILSDIKLNNKLDEQDIFSKRFLKQRAR